MAESTAKWDVQHPQAQVPGAHVFEPADYPELTEPLHIVYEDGGAWLQTNEGPKLLSPEFLAQRGIQVKGVGVETGPVVPQPQAWLDERKKMLERMAQIEANYQDRIRLQVERIDAVIGQRDAYLKLLWKCLDEEQDESFKTKTTRKIEKIQDM